MSEPTKEPTKESKIIAVANLPTSQGSRSPTSSAGATVPKSPSAPSGSSLPPKPSAAPAAPQRALAAKPPGALDIVFKAGFVLFLIVAVIFIFRTLSVQSQLTQAKSETSQAQSQLDQAKAETGKAQANAKDMSEQMAKLQSIQEQAKAEAAAAAAASVKASGEVTSLQAQLEQARGESAAAKASAKKASDDLARLQAQLQAQSTTPAPAETPPIKPAAAQAKPVPLSVSFQKASVGNGNALVLQNTSGATLTVDVKFTSPTSGRNKQYHLVMDSGATKELGSLGAWTLTSGDKVEINSAGYDPIAKTAP